MLHAVIMAGGSGTRFWPASRKLTPKQLLPLAGERSMLQDTVARISDLVPGERTLIVTNEALVDSIRQQLPELRPESIIGEPCKRDTAPCIGLAANSIAAEDPDATMVVMPADHVISPREKFQAALEFAASLVDEKPERIVTFGIRPTYPAESFGYIEAGSTIEVPADAAKKIDTSAYQVKQFREKPKADVAKQYLDAGNFFWNSGIFVWKAGKIQRELSEREPEMFAHLKAIADAQGSSGYDEVFKREFTAIQGKSIDFAVMEHATDVVVIEAPYDWDDLGSWQSLTRLHESDENGNVIIGDHVGKNTEGSIIRGEKGHLIATLGLKNCIVVHTPDATLVANKDDEESIRDIVKLIGVHKLDRYL